MCKIHASAFLVGTWSVRPLCLYAERSPSWWTFRTFKNKELKTLCFLLPTSGNQNTVEEMLFCSDFSCQLRYKKLESTAVRNRWSLVVPILVSKKLTIFGSESLTVKVLDLEQQMVLNYWVAMLSVQQQQPLPSSRKGQSMGSTGQKGQSSNNSTKKKSLDNWTSHQHVASTMKESRT